MSRTLITILLAMLCYSYCVHGAERPNIILIMADDFGYECVTANGGESYQTPHLESFRKA